MTCEHKQYGSSSAEKGTPLDLRSHIGQKGAGVRVGDEAQLVEHLFSMQETLGPMSGMA